MPKNLMTPYPKPLPEYALPRGQYYNRPFTRLLVPFWQAYNILPPEFLKHASEYIVYRGNFILRSQLFRVGFTDIDLLDLQCEHRRLYALEELRVDFQLETKPNGLDVHYKVLHYNKSFTLHFRDTKMTDAEDEIYYTSMMERIRLGKFDDED